ncbi:MAG: cadherin-like domain-containing protein [Oleispira sp.]|nr:cadherin-like domain-containing protein [Oleispira sp.]
MKYLVGLLFILMLTACGDAAKVSENSSINPNPENAAPNAEVPAVSDLIIFSTSASQIVLRWADANNASGYLIRRNGEQIATVAKGLYTFTDNDVIANQSYRYEVIAFNENGSESSAIAINAITIVNTPPTVAALDQVLLFDTVMLGELVAQVNASDIDAQPLSYVINNDLFEIDNVGTLRVAKSLVSVSGKVILLNIEVSDGYSITTAQIKLGIIPITANGDNQGLTRQVYKDASIGSDINTLKQLDAYPDSPTETTIETEFVSPSDIGSNYGQVMQGYIIPPVSGDYYFWVAADDQAELYLSNNETEQGLVQIAQLTSHTSAQEWDRYPGQKSSVQSLSGGKLYYIKAIMTEGGGGDHLAVAWQGPGITRAVIGNDYLRIPLDLQNPSTVTQLTWLKMDHDQILLEWNGATDNSGISHYDIYEDGKKIATTVNESIELNDLVSSKLYNLMVKTVDIAGNESAFSTQLSVQIDDFTAPSMVSGISLISTGPNHIHFNWTESADENNTQVLYRIFQDGQLIHQGYQTELQINKLAAGTVFVFEIEAIDIAGNNSGKSTALSFSTSDHVAGTPIFEYPSFEYAVAANTAANNVFAKLTYQAEATPVLVIESGNAEGYFAVNNSGELSLIKQFLTDSSQTFNLQMSISLAGKSSSVAVIVKAIESSRFIQTGIYQQVWAGISGNSIDLINTKNTLSSQQILAEVKTPNAMGDNYGQRLSGYLKVPTSGLYTFWVASDDHSEVRISADMTTNKAEAVARVSGYTSIDAWGDNNLLKRDIPLAAGQYYYFEVLHKEGSGGDHVSVAWQGPGIAKQLLSASYIIPASSFVPAKVELQTAYQSSFDTLGNEITIEYLVAASAAVFPVTIYYGLVDAGDSSQGWQYTMELGELLAGNQIITLPNIDPGSSYFIRFESTGPAGNSWSQVIKVDTAIIDDSKVVGEALPQTLSLIVNIDDKDLFLELEKHSVRSPNFQLLTFDVRRFQQFQTISPMPEVRTYRGYISNDPYQTVTGVVDSAGTIYLSGWGGDRRQWGRNIDISAKINPDALGNSESTTTELKIDFETPAIVDNRLYLPQSGINFHNNLSRVAFTFRNSQFEKQAGGNILNGIAQMEGHINELDYVWAQKTGLRWDVGNAVIEENGGIEAATQARPSATDSTTFRMTFQDPINGGYCWGGGYWLGCVANYTMNWGFTHEVGHNFGLGHGEQTDNNDQIQQPSTHMGNMQARKTTGRLQQGTRFKPAEALTNPMLPATFKDYLTVYQDQAGTVSPLANDYDANGDVLSIDSFEATTLEGGSVSNNQGILTYTPPAGFVGVDQFSYVAVDTEGYKTRGPVQIQVLTNGLTAHWDMDSLVTRTVNEESVEMIEDLSGQGNDLTAPSLASITPAATLADVQVLGASNQGLSIQLMASAVKANDAIGHSLLPHKLDPGHNSFTAAMWFKYSTIDGDKLLIGKSANGPNNMQYGGWEIRSEGTKLAMQVSYRDRLMHDSEAIAEQEDALIDGAWHHVVMVIDRENNELRGYLDGLALTTQGILPVGGGPIMAAMNSSGYGGGSPFRVGGHSSVVCVGEGDAKVCTVTEGQAFDTVKVFHKALTELEVTVLYAE